MNQNIQDFINGKRIAIVGVSRGGKKFGNSILTELKQRGYQMFVVHPEAKEIQGERCYPNLQALKGQVDGVLISVPPKHATQVLRDAVEAGFKNIWLQQGAESPEVLAAAKELGINPVMKKCILMYAPPVTSLHSFHRFFAQIFGQV
jgi:predicted CoA-binding protein